MFNHIDSWEVRVYAYLYKIVLWTNSLPVVKLCGVEKGKSKLISFTASLELPQVQNIQRSPKFPYTKVQENNTTKDNFPVSPTNGRIMLIDPQAAKVLWEIVVIWILKENVQEQTNYVLNSAFLKDLN